MRNKRDLNDAVPEGRSSKIANAGKSHAATGQKGLTRRDLLAAGVGSAASLLASQSPASASPGDAPIYRIHPAIGVARMGNADPTTFFIGPEIPGQPALGAAPGSSVPPYKVDGNVKPQAARFRIFEYARIDGRLTPVREVNLSTPGVNAIKWTAHLANRKASFYRFLGPPGETSPPGGLRNASVADRKSLEIDFLERSIAGSSQGPVEFRKGTSSNPAQETFPTKPDGTPVINFLGQLRTDDQGRLIVIGGQGRAGSSAAAPPPLFTYANNDGWFDDASDGPVTATITLADGREIPVDAAGGAWVLVAPPDFAPYNRNAVSQYDLHFDLALRSIPIPPDNALYDDGGPLARLRQLKADFQPDGDIEFPNTAADFVAEIQPILVTAYEYWFVTALVTQKHASLIDPNLQNPDPQFAKDRQGVFVYVRVPPGAAINGIGPRTMPRLLGDSPYDGHANEGLRKLHLTRTQYGLLRNWANGFFVPTSSPPPPAITPHGLDKAALDNCVGGAFFPGIETGWQIRNPSLFIEPFRIDLAGTSGYWGEDGLPLRAGHFSRQMAVPWHADFNDCRNEGDFGWWPGQRPDDVYNPPLRKRVPWARPDDRFTGGNLLSTHDDMVANWYKFGFVVPDGDTLIESERDPSIP